MRTLCCLLVAACCLAATSSWASTYYVTVAGLGGEPDYEQRFTANAMDLDKVFKAAVGAHVTTLTGKQATKAKLTEVMNQVAREAKPEDDLVVTLMQWEEVKDVERLGIEEETVEVLGVDIPHVTIPVRPGHDNARLIEVAAFQVKLRKSGYNAADELDKRLQAHMAERKIA